MLEFQPLYACEFQPQNDPKIIIIIKKKINVLAGLQ